MNTRNKPTTMTAFVTLAVFLLVIASAHAQTAANKPVDNSFTLVTLIMECVEFVITLRFGLQGLQFLSSLCALLERTFSSSSRAFFFASSAVWPMARAACSKVLLVMLSSLPMLLLGIPHPQL
jgi:hypothetical protein